MTPRARMVLAERLGEDGYGALAEWLAEERATMLTTFTERLDRRLAQECGQLRVGMADLGAGVHQALHQLRADLQIAIADRSTAVLKWALVFWVGQAAALAAMVATLMSAWR